MNFTPRFAQSPVQTHLAKMNSLLRFRPWVKHLITALVVLLIIQATIQLASDCTLFPRFDSPWLLAALILAILYRFINAYGWVIVLNAMGHGVDGKQAVRIWLLSESRRWLPGGIWGYASRATQSNDLGVGPGAASASMLIELAITVAASCLVVVPALWVLPRDLIQNLLGEIHVHWIVLGVVVLLSGLLGLRIFRSSVADRWRKLQNRFEVLRTVQISWPGIGKATSFYVLMALMNGVVTVFLFWSMPMDSPPAFAIIAATSLAWIVGLFAIFAPGGLFVREAIFGLCLVAWVPYPTAIAVAVLARLLQMIAELAGVAWLVATRNSSCIASSLPGISKAK